MLTLENSRNFGTHYLHNVRMLERFAPLADLRRMTPSFRMWSIHFLDRVGPDAESSCLTRCRMQIQVALFVR